MRFNRIPTLLLTLSIFATACPGGGEDTDSSAGDTVTTGSTAVMTTTGSPSSFSSTEAPTSTEPPCHDTSTTDTDDGTSTGGSTSDLTSGSTSTGPAMTDTDSSSGSGSATETGTGSSTTDAPTGGNDPVCYMNLCDDDNDCDDGSVCFAAIEALNGVKTCSISCETTNDCGNGCGGAPTAICSAQGICEPVVCEIGIADCLCQPWINGVLVCA